MQPAVVRALRGYGPAEQSSQDMPGHDDTLNLRIAGIFVILAAGLLGAAPPLFLKAFQHTEGVLTRFVRSSSAGIIAALALVHIVPEAVAELDGIGGLEYPLGGVCVLTGVLAMVLLEHIAHALHEARGTSGSAPPCQHYHHRHQQQQAAVRHTPSIAAAAASRELVEALVADAPLPAGLLPLTPRKGSSNAAVPHAGHHHQHGNTTPGLDHPYPHTTDHHHHVCVSHGDAANWVAASAAEADAVASPRLKVMAYMFELGCIFHSVVIGIALGVINNNVSEARALFIALAFHQLLEGLSLATVISTGGIPRAKALVMVTAYSLMCPAGVGIGIAVSETYDGESTAARAVQGSLNGVSGGMLLYMALVQLVAEDMSRCAGPAPEGAGRYGRLLSFAGLLGGAAAMCVLAVWA